MNFITFIRALPQQQDKALSRFIDIAKKEQDFPSSSDPIKLAQYIYLKLDPEATLGFQKMLMIYAQMEPSNQIPPQYKSNQNKMLQAINFVLELQDNDQNYPFAHLLPKNQQR